MGTKKEQPPTLVGIVQSSDFCFGDAPEDGFLPEEWVCSSVEALNEGSTKANKYQKYNYKVILHFYASPYKMI